MAAYEKPKPKLEAITHWQKEQFLKEFNDREEVFFLELAQRSISKDYPVCRDLYFFCYFSTLRFRFLSQAGHDARFSYVYAWGLKDLNDKLLKVNPDWKFISRNAETLKKGLYDSWKVAVNKVKSKYINPDKIQYHAYRGLIHGYLHKWQAEDEEDYNNKERYLYNHFNNSNIKVLNLANVYNELVRISSS